VKQASILAFFKNESETNLAKQTLHIQELTKIEAKRPLLIPDIRKIEAK
jgi:hypothetical protein